MKRVLLSTAAGALALCAFSYGAQATTFYSESFDPGTFQGANQVDLSSDPGGNTSDRYATTTYWNIISTGGWTFSGTKPLFAAGEVSPGVINGAVELNEPSGVALTIQTPQGAAGAGLTYYLGFTYWGDNRPGQAWGLNVTVNGDTTSLTGTDGTPGQYASGFSAIIPVVADINGVLNITFAQNSPGGSQASPIFDDVRIGDSSSEVGATPFPAALPMFGAGLGLVGFLARRRKRKNASAVAA